MTTDNTTSIRIWDTRYEFIIEVDLVKAIAAARTAYLQLKEAKELEAEKRATHKNLPPGRRPTLRTPPAHAPKSRRSPPNTI